MKIRVVKTAFNATAVQVVRYQNNKRIVLQHIGSAHSTAALNDKDIGRRMDKRLHQTTLHFSS